MLVEGLEPLEAHMPPFEVNGGGCVEIAGDGGRGMIGYSSNFGGTALDFPVHHAQQTRLAALLELVAF
jgi:hypothetical protein